MSEEKVAQQPEESLPTVQTDGMAEIQRREKALRIRENKLKQELDAQRASILEEFKTKPLVKLQELGLSTESLADQFLNGATEVPEDMTKRELQEIKAQLKAQQKQDQDRQVAEFRKEVYSHVEKDADKYELINNHRDGKDRFWNAVIGYYEEYGEAPSNYTEIADKVEAELLDQAKKLLLLKKLRPAEAPPAKSEVSKEETSTPKVKTISNAMTASSSPSNRVTLSGNNPTSTAHSSKLEALRAEKLRAALTK